MVLKMGLSFVLCVTIAGCAHAHSDQAPKPAALEQSPTIPPTATPEIRPVIMPPAAIHLQPGTRPEAPGNRPPDDRPRLIVAIGDSITVGVGDISTPNCLSTDRARAGAASRLAQMEHRPVINEGVCGEDSFRGRKRIHTVLDRWQPDIVLILYSPNDLNHKLSDVVDNLRLMIVAAKQRDVIPVIGTLTPTIGSHRDWQPFIIALNAQIRHLAAAERIALADHYRVFETDPRFRQSPGLLLSPDGLHPNGHGYDIMARTWFRELHQAGLVSQPSK